MTHIYLVTLLFTFVFGGLPDNHVKPNGANHGFFRGAPVSLRHEPDGDHYIVMKALSYTDVDGHFLQAYRGFKTDCASIPKLLWSSAGAPCNGKYVEAAVIHDVGCDTHKYTWQITHRMFYDAMIDSGVSSSQAALFYFAVRRWGPKWEVKSAEGQSIAEVQMEIGKNTLIGKIEERSATTLAGKRKIYRAKYIEILPAREVDTNELTAIRKEIYNRENHENPMSAKEIEIRTEK